MYVLDWTTNTDEKGSVVDVEARMQLKRDIGSKGRQRRSRKHGEGSNETFLFKLSVKLGMHPSRQDFTGDFTEGFPRNVTYFVKCDVRESLGENHVCACDSAGMARHCRFMPELCMHEQSEMCCT